MIKIQRATKENIRYIPQDQRAEGVHDPAVFIMRHLDADKRAAIKDEQIVMIRDGVGEEEKMHFGIRMNTAALRMVLARLVGWENIVQAEGGPIPFDTTDKRGMWEMLPESYQKELIREFGGLD